ncbi:MAG TPA: hypothetical protein VND45_03830, partial [Thermoanaerobaculia bacterium]|nr:hypothetical protein [Thermoanaerobaculia bacterium]
SAFGGEDAARPAAGTAAFHEDAAPPTSGTPAFPPPPPVEDAPPPFPEESPFDRTRPPFEEAIETGDVEPMLAAHDDSPFEEPATLASAIEIEHPSGMHIDVAPLTAEVPAPVAFDEPDVFEPEPVREQPAAEDPVNTLTMADLYVRQGLVNDARHIYENILARDPDNLDVRAKLDAIAPRMNPKIERLERWLSKVSKREVAGV